MINEDPSLNIKWNQFENPGYMILDLPSELLDGLRKNVSGLINGGFNAPKLNSQLAGNIEREYKLTPDNSFFNFVVYSCVLYHQKYIKSFDKKVFANPKFSDIWVNLQKKYEYNPVHDHSGDFSFVTWINVPYTFEDEKKTLSSIDAYGSTAGSFQFQYVNSIGKIQSETIHVDKQWEGKMIVFPASLHHCVYPFYTSDDYRISIAGNLSFKE